MRVTSWAYDWKTVFFVGSRWSGLDEERSKSSRLQLYLLLLGVMHGTKCFQQVCSGYGRNNLVSPGKWSHLMDMTVTRPQSSYLTLCSFCSSLIPQSIIYIDRKGLLTWMQVKWSICYWPSLWRLRKGWLEVDLFIIKDVECVYRQRSRSRWENRLKMHEIFLWQLIRTIIKKLI